MMRLGFERDYVNGVVAPVFLANGSNLTLRLPLLDYSTYPWRQITQFYLQAGLYRSRNSHRQIGIENAAIHRNVHRREIAGIAEGDFVECAVSAGFLAHIDNLGCSGLCADGVLDNLWQCAESSAGSRKGTAIGVVVISGRRGGRGVGM